VKKPIPKSLNALSKSINNNPNSAYDNLQGSYNVSDFLKRIADEKKFQIEKEQKDAKIQRIA
jgi:hypothetical protein